jgi:predicted RNA binding protein YcfA (HicA-like mRNA interferase family)
MSMKKEVHQLIELAVMQGWSVERTKGSHLKWLSPLGAIMFSASTPSDTRAIQNIKKELRLRGFIELKKNKRRK